MKISVIIPTYNVEEYIEKAIDSVLEQTTEENIEIIIVDDKSTDNTLEKVKEKKKESKRKNREINIIELTENKRQGYARNRALEKAKGEFIFFLDGDDFVDKDAFKIMLEKEEPDTDFIMCDWCYYYEDKGKVFQNANPFMNVEKIEGEDCEELLNSTPFFTVNKLYKKSFLQKNNIKYGEGYIYEDVEFFVLVAQHANKINVVQNPFYNVRINQNSTTKTNTKSMLHIDSFLIAAENTYKLFKPRGKLTNYHLNKYIIKKALDYAHTRAPLGKKKYTVQKITAIMNAYSTRYSIPKKTVPLYYYLFQRKYVQQGKHSKIIKTYKLYKNKKLAKRKENLEKLKKAIKENPIGSKMYAIRLAKAREREMQKYKNQGLKKGKVLMFGFDYKYEGNSKYLFDYLQEKGYKVVMVTEDKRVPQKKQVKARTMEFYKEFYSSEFVIFESWIPLDFEKTEGQKWIQLWHGTPYKKLLFDSHEKDIMATNKSHKKQKARDIKRWDILLADSEIALRKFRSAFAIDEEKIQKIRYPRVQWLKDNQNNEQMKEEIKNKLGIKDKNKKIITYMPTWRDYNHKKKEEQFDLNYVLDLNYINEQLGDEYVIINKNHPLAKGKLKTDSENIIENVGDLETQEILLISDIVITDYSSVIFDVLAEKEVYIIEKDYEKYELSRGVYADMRKELKDVISKEEKELVKKIKTGVQLSKETKILLTSEKFENAYKKIEEIIKK